MASSRAIDHVHMHLLKPNCGFTGEEKEAEASISIDQEYSSQ